MASHIWTGPGATEPRRNGLPFHKVVYYPQENISCGSAIFLVMLPREQFCCFFYAFEIKEVTKEHCMKVGKQGRDWITK